MLSIADEVAEAFSLGAPIDSNQVSGGLSNDLWRLTTDTGTFAVKVMRANTSNPEFRGNVEAAYAIEATAYRRGVPCPEPVSADGVHCLAQVAGELVRVHRWVNGRAVDGSRWLENAGSLVAQIHGAAEPFNAALDDEPWDADGWASLADHTEMPDGLGQSLRDAAPDLAQLEGVTAASGLETLHANSHGDLDPKNTLSVGDELIALDWDAAGAQPIVREAASVALDWSTSREEFKRVIAAYGDCGGVRLPAEPWVFGGWVSALGGWLVYNATSRPSDPLGQEQTRLTCERLLRLHASLNHYVDALRSV